MSQRNYLNDMKRLSEFDKAPPMMQLNGSKYFTSITYLCCYNKNFVQFYGSGSNFFTKLICNFIIFFVSLQSEINQSTKYDRYSSDQSDPNQHP